MAAWNRILTSNVGKDDAVIKTVTATITSGQSLSTAFDTDFGEQRKFLAVVIPAAWDDSDLTFQASGDGSNYYDLYAGSTETVCTGAGRANRMVFFDSTVRDGGAIAYLRYLKIRSGTGGSPVTQNADRTLTVLVN